jgi:hypothetical protein
LSGCATFQIEQGEQRRTVAEVLDHKSLRRLRAIGGYYMRFPVLPSTNMPSVSAVGGLQNDR